MRPIKAISFLSLHAAFPSFCLVESGGKKTVVTFRATTLQFYRDFEQRSTRKCNAAVIILPHRLAGIGLQQKKKGLHPADLYKKSL
ncbi:MAG TPA: hypothetical protein DEA88_11370 [Erwinia persicina]|nr:hypothetical protein [Erwinia persicina]HBH67906.1 hypothetical protein [Erwinia persicina]HBI06519.1 hypothetical protein [Erwinia persicina]HBT13774.1 hypothetical protein [Erwinia persicina]HBT28823.1 hypothetical protein [Erwinia persicina]